MRRAAGEGGAVFVCDTLLNAIQLQSSEVQTHSRHSAEHSAQLERVGRGVELEVELRAELLARDGAGGLGHGHGATAMI